VTLFPTFAVVARLGEARVRAGPLDGRGVGDGLDRVEGAGLSGASPWTDRLGRDLAAAFFGDAFFGGARFGDAFEGTFAAGPEVDGNDILGTGLRVVGRDGAASRARKLSTRRSGPSPSRIRPLAPRTVIGARGRAGPLSAGPRASCLGIAYIDAAEIDSQRPASRTDSIATSNVSRARPWRAL
jgi:hypothetical protein